MFWVDEIVQKIIETYPDKKEFIVRDEKTASGRVHIGSLRGVAIHAVIAQALREAGKKAIFYYEINDVDPMDGLPVYVSKNFKKYMGKPLKDVPPPDENGEPDEEAFKKDSKNNYARYFGNEFIDVITHLGFETKFIWASDLYSKGTYDKWLDILLKHPDEIRTIYKEVSGSDKSSDWMPLNVVCEKCGKVGTTTVQSYDGKEVTYVCEKNKVEWAQGCGYEGKMSPFGLKGKLPWKVEWAAKWAGLGVDVEGSGKDHNTAGGAHEISERISKEVLKMPVPFNIPYEFFLFGGAKMSASKGVGASAKEISDLLPKELLRFLMLRTRPNQPIDFNPEGETIPRLYDNHDECALNYFAENSENPDLGRAFYYSQLDSKDIKKHFLPRLSRIAFMLQIPHLDVLEEVEKLKGAKLTKNDKEEAEERTKYAKMFLSRFASDSAKFEIQKEIPEITKNLSEDQKKFLHDIAKMLEANKNMKGEDLHTKIHELKNSSTLSPRDAFSAIYAALLGKESGPQAGWFLEALDRDFVIERFNSL